MILDKQNLFSDRQSLIPTTPILSTNTIDLGASGVSPILGQLPARDVGQGEPLDLLVQVVETATGGTSVIAAVIQADDAALTSNVEVLAQSGVVALASLVAGYQFKVPFVPTGINKRYLGVRYTTAGTFTAGLVTAGIVADRQSR